MAIVTSTVIGGIMLQKKVKNSTVVYRADENNNQQAEESVPVNATTDTQPENENVDTQALQNTEENKEREKTSSSKVEDGSVTLNVLGEIMMGGDVTDNLNYLYMQAFKEVYNEAKSADFTYANFSTNITNLEKIQDAKSKYLVTKEVINGLHTLGLDAVSIASDHMIDYPQEIFQNTVNTLEKNDIFVAGRENTPVYLEKGDKKIAIVSTNAVFVGTSKNYNKYGISTYTLENMKKNIKEAKEAANIVIVDVHWGRDHTYGVTDQMRNIATAAIDSGADMVMGSHALGVYPLVTYQDKPILYSTGYFISDLEYTVAKEGFIFGIHISKEGKIDEIKMTPTYVEDKKQVVPYESHNSEKAKTYLEQFNIWQKDNSLNSQIQDNQIVVKL